jgi:thioredoxin-related protein
MPEIIARMGILILVSLLLWLLVWSGRRFVEMQRRRVLAAPALEAVAESEGEDSRSFVRILAFSSADCKQCHQLQAPVLRRVQEKHGVAVTVVEVDAPTHPELVEQYHVLTVPTTVIMDASGRAHAVNYGFANTQRLLAQVDAVLTQVPQKVC